MLSDSKAIARRVARMMAALAAAGTLGFGIAKGPWWGLSFLGGAAISAASFFLTHLLVEHLGPQVSKDEPPPASNATLMGMRYIVLGAAGYGMIRGLGLQPEAVVGGLLIAVAAVLAEVLYELIHGT
jgi:hypothetical protein